MIAKYVRIADDLRRAIEHGTYPPGSTLPGESELLTSYGVSRGTVRQAVAMLTNEGLVIPMPGIGTMVREIQPVAVRYTTTAPSPLWTTSAGDDATDIVVLAEPQPADPEIAERLNIKSDAPTVHRIRHESKGQGLVQVHEQWIPEALVTAIRDTTGINLADKDDPHQPGDLFALLRQAGHDPTETSETIGARMPTPDERDVLGIPVGTPVLVNNRTTRAENMPVETSIIVAAADRKTSTFTVSLRDRR